VDLGKGVEVGEEGIVSRAKENERARNGKEFVGYDTVEGVVNRLELVGAADDLFHAVEGGVGEKFVALVRHPSFGDDGGAHVLVRLEEDVVTMELDPLRGAKHAPEGALVPGSEAKVVVP
jgi:hypothetical protein